MIYIVTWIQNSRSNYDFLGKVTRALGLILIMEKKWVITLIILLIMFNPFASEGKCNFCSQKMFCANVNHVLMRVCLCILLYHDMVIIETLIKRSNLWPQWPWDIQNGHQKWDNALNLWKHDKLPLILHILFPVFTLGL